MTDEDKGFITRCYIHGRPDADENAFYCREDGTIVATLDRYAIVPIECFDPEHPDHENTMRNCRELAAKYAGKAVP